MPISYLIFNKGRNWYLSLNGETRFGPIKSYAEAEKYAKVLSTLESQLKDVA